MEFPEVHQLILAEDPCVAVLTLNLILEIVRHTVATTGVTPKKLL